MASPESRRIRATFVRGGSPADSSVEADRKAWEAEVAPTNQALDVAVAAVDVDGLPGEWVGHVPSRDEPALLLLHGGGYTAGSCRTHRALAAQLATAAGAAVLLVDYRLAPEQPFPAAVDDAVVAYRWLLRGGFSPGRLLLGGDSAGGGLAAAALVRLRDEGDPLPAGAALLSPWTDLAMTGESLIFNDQVDPLGSAAALHRAARHYLGDQDPRHPLASPLYANLAGLPPLLIQAGADERLLSDSVRLAERARAAGVAVELEVVEEMWHVFQSWAPDLPEACQAIASIGAFARRVWGQL